jgi:FMN-dependent NADH-azoreductase
MVLSHLHHTDTLRASGLCRKGSDLSFVLNEELKKLNQVVRMKKLLYIQASPRIDRSHSIAVADAFVASYRENNPHDEIMAMNLFKKDLIPFDGLAVQAKYTILHGKEHTQEELYPWRAVETLIEEFKSADKNVMAVPI